ncbi:MAG: hypothetical protein WCI53_05700 [Bacteroidota bacterium]|jgi:squalene cyclase
MTHSEKLLKKEFKIQSMDELQSIIDKKTEAFFQFNFFTDSKTYRSNILKLIDEINSDGDLIGIEISAMKSGSMIRSFATQAYSETIGKYKNQRKALVNHVRILLNL